MKKLYEILGQRLNAGDVGVEIEVEGRRFPDEVDPRWVATVDGSLRGENREYVFDGPLPAAEVKDALLALENNLKNSVLDFSFRTSVHVHINCQELTYPQYLNFLYTYFLLEEPLMNFCGKERKGNRFCLRLQDAEGMMEAYNMLFAMENGFHHIPPNQVRYSAMNVEATTKFGSLEFRGMKGNLDVPYITTWVDALMALREFAKSVDSPVDVYNQFAELEAQGFMEKVLGKLAAKFYYPRVYREIQRSFSLSLDLPFTYANHLNAKVAKKKAVPAAAMPRKVIGDNLAVGGGGGRIGGFVMPPMPAFANADAIHRAILQAQAREPQEVEW